MSLAARTGDVARVTAGGRGDGDADGARRDDRADRARGGERRRRKRGRASVPEELVVVAARGVDEVHMGRGGRLLLLLIFFLRSSADSGERLRAPPAISVSCERESSSSSKLVVSKSVGSMRSPMDAADLVPCKGLCDGTTTADARAAAVQDAGC